MTGSGLSDPRDDLMLEGSSPDLKRFVPVRVTLPAVAYGGGKVWFEYDAADPFYGSYWAPGMDPDEGSVDPRDMRTWYDQETSSRRFLLGQGTMRLWMKQAHEARDGASASFDGTTRVGDYLDSTEPDSAGTPEAV